MCIANLTGYCFFRVFPSKDKPMKCGLPSAAAIPVTFSVSIGLGNPVSSKYEGVESSMKFPS